MGCLQSFTSKSASQEETKQNNSLPANQPTSKAKKDDKDTVPLVTSPVEQRNSIELHPKNIRGESANSFKAKYKMVDSDLGTGAYSVVKLATNRETKESVAVKCISRSGLSKDDERCIRQEVEILKTCNHPNIVKFYEFYETSKTFFITMEVMEGGELFNRIIQKRCYDENEARDVIFLVLSAIRYCHDLGIVHRDLKPENLLLKSKDNDTEIKVVDFGFATVATSDVALRTRCGSMGYTAPEILKYQSYGAPVDMWSIGVITFVLIGGYPPFRHDNEYQLNKIIKEGKFNFEPKYWKTVSDDAKELIRRMLTVNPSQRITADEALSHPWFKKSRDVLKSNSLGENFDVLKEFVTTGKFKNAVASVIEQKRKENVEQVDDTKNSAVSALEAEDEEDGPASVTTAPAPVPVPVPLVPETNNVTAVTEDQSSIPVSHVTDYVANSANDVSNDVSSTATDHTSPPTPSPTATASATATASDSPVSESISTAATTTTMPLPSTSQSDTPPPPPV